jgi:hypothetical protein
VFVAIICVAGAIFTGACAFGAFMYRKKLKHVQSVELSDIADLDEGTGKIHGRVIAIEEPIKAPVTGVPCVYYSLVLEEEHVWTETYTERVGNRSVRKTRTRREWRPILNEVKYISVSIKDETGKAELEFDNAEMTIKSKERNASGLTSKLSDKAVGRLVRLYPKHAKVIQGKCRYTEVVVEEDDKLLVMGEVTLLKGKKPLFAYEKKKPLYVSDLTDEEFQRHLKKYMIWLFVGAGFFLVATIVGAVLVGRKK